MVTGMMGGQETTFSSFNGSYHFICASNTVLGIVYF